jgi:hypothetical protein
MRFDRVVPEEIARALQFEAKTGKRVDGTPIYKITRLKVTFDGKLKAQTLRNVRRLREPSAELLESLLPQPRGRLATDDLAFSRSMLPRRSLDRNPARERYVFLA